MYLTPVEFNWFD